MNHSIHSPKTFPAPRQLAVTARYGEWPLRLSATATRLPSSKNATSKPPGHGHDHRPNCALDASRHCGPEVAVYTDLSCASASGQHDRMAAARAPEPMPPI